MATISCLGLDAGPYMRLASDFIHDGDDGNAPVAKKEAGQSRQQPRQKRKAELSHKAQQS
jgi:hypothetical protein